MRACILFMILTRFSFFLEGITLFLLFLFFAGYICIPGWRGTKRLKQLQLQDQREGEQEQQQQEGQLELQQEGQLEVSEVQRVERWGITATATQQTTSSSIFWFGQFSQLNCESAWVLFVAAMSRMGLYMWANMKKRFTY